MEDSLFVQITDFSDKMIAAQSCKFLESRSAGLLSYSSHAVINAYHTDASKLADKTPSVSILALLNATKFRCEANDQLSICL